MTKKLPDLSKAEWVLMKSCWDKGKCTARDVYEEAVKQRGWQYQTVKTMLDRLVSKGYLKRDKVGPICLYQPSVPRSKVIPRAIDSFASTVLGDTFAPFFAYLASGRRLSEEEIASLKKLVEEHKEDEEP